MYYNIKISYKTVLLHMLVSHLSYYTVVYIIKAMRYISESTNSRQESLSIADEPRMILLQASRC